MIDIKYKNYLNKILEEYYKVHLNPEHNISKDELIKYIENYLSKNNVTNNYEFRFFILHILKQLNGNLDNHTCLGCKYSLPLPFELKYLNDGFYVSDSVDKEIKYSKLIKINNIDIDDICKSMEQITSYETILWLYLKEQKQLKDMYFLRMLPEIGNNTNEFVYTFVKDNKRIERKYNKESCMNINKNCFENNASYKIIDNKIIYKLNSCLKDEKYGFKEKIDRTCKEMVSFIENNDISEFILDLRGNSGGSDTILGPLYSLFDEYMDKLSFKVLVDRGTFSCGTIILRYLLERGNITVIGEGIGEPFNDFGNFNNIVKLDDVFSFYASNKYFCFNDNHLFWTQDKQIYNKLTNEQKRPLEYQPDIIVSETIDDVINNKDIVLEIALSNNYSRYIK